MLDWDEAERVRERLAHRLHDGPIQELTAAQLFLDALALRMQSGDADPALRDSLERGLTALRNATAGCRHLMDSLRPGLEGEGELAERLHRAALDLTADVAVVVEVPDGFGKEHRDAALAVYRLVEDLLGHLRERGATLRRLEVTSRDGATRVAVETAGDVPVDEGAASWEAVRRRVRDAGGTLDSGGDGIVRVDLPVPAGAEVP